jgi:putative peptidoglycan lipid II flippase
VVGALGAPGAASFIAATLPVTNFYQLLANGATDGALVPVFNDYAAAEKRQEMRRIVFTVVNLVLIIAVVASILYALFAPWFINFLVSGYSTADKALTLRYSQVIFFSVVALGPFAVLLAALFALKEFGWPAFATASYHVGVIVGAIVTGLISSHYIGVLALPVGLLLGAVGQIVLLLPGIRNKRLYYLFVLDLKHPAIRRIIKLYWPIAISLVFSTALVLFDLRLQSLTPQHAAGTAAMGTATTLIQFPIGLVAQALSVAVLPTLAEHAREHNTERFKETLLLGFRLGMLLMIPAMTGLLVLRLPIVYLIFAHHNYSIANANLTATALQNYAYQLPFVVLDQLLIAAFYARKNTRIPVTIYIVSILFYLLVALPFYSNVGVPALAFANTVQNSAHAIILLILLRLAIGSLHIRRTIPTLVKICLAALLMALVAWGVQLGLAHVALFSLSHLSGQFLTLIVSGGLATVIYFGAILLFKVEEINLVKDVVMKKLGKKS